jgi:hypothetical protein
VPDPCAADGEFAALAGGGVQRIEDGGPVVGVDGRHDGDADGARGVEAEQVGDGLGGEGDPQPAVEDDHRVDAALHERAERGLAALQIAGEPPLPPPQRGLEGDQGGDPGHGQDDTEDGAHGEKAAHDEGDGDEGDGDEGDGDESDGEEDRGNDEEPGAPTGGHDRGRSRWLPHAGGGGHTV